VREDQRTIVVNKMPGLVCEPGLGHRADSLLNGLFALDGGRLAARLARLGEARDWGLLHRLDALTSGLVVVALDAEAYDRLREGFERRTVAKTYLAIVRGELSAEGRSAEPIAERRERDRLVAVVDPAGRAAETRWTTLARSGRYALLRCEPVTGRLHQIRLHLARLGAPVAGDPLYESGGRARASGRTPQAPELHLHAWRLAVPDPAYPATDGPSTAMIRVEAGVPRRFAAFAEDHGLPLPVGVAD
jgi:23S rRNA pseudouridine1911/1915/1917 synthase